MQHEKCPISPLAASFWRNHAWLPLGLYLVAFTLLEVAGYDLRIADTWYSDASHGMWLGEGAGKWWARDLLHTGGRWAVRLVAAGAIVAWAGSYAMAGWRRFRRGASFVAVAMLLSTSIVGGLKVSTNVDCPWDLAAYGGSMPYVPLFADRPNSLPRSKCFPGAHSSSGFALCCFYFLWRDRSKRLAIMGLGLGLAVGIAFSIGQEARGAHFVSHDLTSAAVVWFVQLLLYGCWLRPRLAGVSPDS